MPSLANSPALFNLARKCKGCPDTLCKGCHETGHGFGLLGWLEGPAPLLHSVSQEKPHRLLLVLLEGESVCLPDTATGDRSSRLTPRSGGSRSLTLLAFAPQGSGWSLAGGGVRAETKSWFVRLNIKKSQAFGNDRG